MQIWFAINTFLKIKINGHRIELGEIEDAISNYQYIKKVKVLKQEINKREFITAYYTADKKIAISKIREFISSFLPKYMIPSFFIELEEFPYTLNGKINKKMLNSKKSGVKWWNVGENV